MNVPQPTEPVQKQHLTVTCSTRVTRNILFASRLQVLIEVSIELNKTMNYFKLAEISFQMLPSTPCFPIYHSHMIHLYLY